LLAGAVFDLWCLIIPHFVYHRKDTLLQLQTFASTIPDPFVEQKLHDGCVSYHACKPSEAPGTPKISLPYSTFV
jgi:hypothetical protein